MTTYKTIHDRENPYAMISLEVLRDPMLSGKAVRLLIYLLSMPPGWQPNPRHLAKELREGVYAITSAIGELKKRGFLVCRRLRDEAGRLIGSEWDINEKPIVQSDEPKDIHGNVIKVVRKSAKSKDDVATTRSPNQEIPTETQAESITATSFFPCLENPITGNCTRDNIDQLNKDFLERESDDFFEKEEIDFDKKETEFTQKVTEPIVFQSDKYSAPAESGKKDPWVSETEFKRFRTELTRLAFNKGIKNPSGWVYRIIENILAGKPSVYLDEFNANMPLGTSDQREWEIAPGVVYPIVKRCVEQDYLSQQGATPERAARKAGETLSRPEQMAPIWEAVKARIMFKKGEWDRQSAIGVGTPAFDPWMVEKPPVSDKEAAIALQEMQSVQRLLPGSAIAQIDLGDRAIEETDGGESKAAAIAAIREKLSRFNSTGNRRRG